MRLIAGTAFGQRAPTPTIQVWRDFLAVPGRLVNQGHRHVLHLPRDYPLRAELLGAAKAIQRLRLRQKF
jgi:hypothetical protein